MNATFVTLARNHDVWDMAKSIRQVEDRFNRNYHYDWVFLNDKPFDETFKKITTALVSGTTYYGLIPQEHWSYPEWIDQEKAKKVREDMGQKKIIYGDSESYRHMCRYESGFFFRHPLMMNYEYYWRVEPSIELLCDIPFDPFRFMKENNKMYSFVLSLYEYYDTIPTLWDSVKKFMGAYPGHIAEGNSMEFLSDDGGKTFNKCHFVSALLPFFLDRPLIIRTVVKLRGGQPGLAAVRPVYRLLQLFGPGWRFLLRALGRRPRPLYRRRDPATQGADPFLQRHCLLPHSVHALSGQ